MARVERSYQVAVGTGGQRNTELLYNIYDVELEQQAIDLLVANAEAIYNNRYAAGFLVERTAHNQWLGTVTYEVGAPEDRASESPVTGESGGGMALQFDVRGEIQRVTHSLETVGRYGEETPPDFFGAIHVSPNGVEGTDVPFPLLSWAETHYFPYDAITADYLQNLRDCVGKVVGSDFRGFERGEVLVEHAAGGLRPDKPIWEVTFRFTHRENRKNFYIGRVLIPEKLGHDYMWIYYVPTMDEESQTLVQIPTGVYIERVYGFCDISQLRLNR